MSEQPINSLDRFRKRSPHLVLEQHTHSEVPTGCGGLVIRWRNPHTAVPLVLSLYSPGKAKLYLDGAEVECSGVDLAPGPHLLAVALEGVNLAGGLFMFAALQQTDEYLSMGRSALGGAPWRLVSQADRTWLATLDEPASPDWTRAEFGDADWLGLVRFVDNPTLTWREENAYQAHWCNEFLAAFLALPPGRRGRGRVWVRKRFVVPPPETT
jgi:hypothetical protein